MPSPLLMQKTTHIKLHGRLGCWTQTEHAAADSVTEHPPLCAHMTECMHPPTDMLAPPWLTYPKRLKLPEQDSSCSRWSHVLWCLHAFVRDDINVAHT